MGHRPFPPGNSMKRRGLFRRITRGVLPPLVICLILSCSFFSAFATLPDLPSNVTKLGVPVSSTQDTNEIYSWSHFGTCSCGAALYSFSRPYEEDSVPVGSLVFISLTQYSQNAYRFSACGKVMGTVEEAFYNFNHTSNSNVMNCRVGTFRALDVNINTYRTLLVFHGDKADWDVPTVWSIVYPSLPVYSSINDAFMEFVYNGKRTVYDCASVAVAYFAVPIYQDALDDYYDDREVSSYNAGQTNAWENAESFELVPYVFDVVGDVIYSAVNNISFYGISLTFLIFLVVLGYLVSTFLRFR